MAKKYYIDTSIWMDLYEDRKGYNNEPLGDYAFKLLSVIKTRKDKLIITDLLIRELEINYSVPEINGMMKLFEDIIEKIIINKEQMEEASKIAKERNVPSGDVLHAIITRDYDFIFITRDKHFRQLVDICAHYKPEEII